MEITEILSQTIATVLVATTAAVGGILNSWLNKKSRERKDMAAACEKLRMLCEKLGLQAKCIRTMDDVFNEIRRINAELEKRKDG